MRARGRRRVVAALAVSGALFAVQPAEAASRAVLAVGAACTNVAYVPVKLAVAILGGAAGGVVGAFTGGDRDAAYAIWVPAMTGTYFVTPAILAGEKPFEFFGSDREVEAPPRMRGVIEHRKRRPRCGKK